MKKILYIFSLVLFVFSCTDDADDVVFTNLIIGDYITPANNSICEGVFSVDQNSVDVILSWNVFSNNNPTDITYTVVLTNLDLDTSETIILNNGVANTTVTLEVNTVYEWTVTATNTAGDSVTGATGQFHTPYEALTNYAPFPATLNAPQNDVVLTAGTIDFMWTGNDPDTGETTTLVYDLYLGTVNPPTQHTAGITNQNVSVALTAGTYYWSVKSIDVNGNASYSTVKSFIVQ